MRPFVLLLSLAALSGCGIAPISQGPMPMPATVPVAAPPPPATPGAIYRSGIELSLFQDQRARNPGDLITIQLVESTNATTSASTKTSKKSDMDMSVTSLFGGKKGLGNKLLDNSAASGRSFDGSGDSSQSNKLEGNLTVTVAARLANGNLLVRGEKWIQLNQGNEYVQIQGIVRPADIAPDNSIPSSRVADARIAYGGRGTLANSNAMGWLSRFFNSPAFPM
ncbi:MAG TPA: flagellar basal body L-ring protein FlgH [Rudaea sp.]